MSRKTIDGSLTIIDNIIVEYRRHNSDHSALDRSPPELVRANPPLAGRPGL